MAHRLVVAGDSGHRGARVLGDAASVKRGRTCPCRNGDEYDAFTKWRRILSWKRGELRRIKRKYSRRSRRRAREEVSAEVDNWCNYYTAYEKDICI